MSNSAKTVHSRRYGVAGILADSKRGLATAIMTLELGPVVDYVSRRVHDGARDDADTLREFRRFLFLKASERLA